MEYSTTEIQAFQRDLEIAQVEYCDYILLLKKIQLYEMNNSEKNMINSCIVIETYSILEGFIKKAFRILFSSINNLAIKSFELKKEILFYHIESITHLEQNRDNQDSRFKLLDHLLKILNEPIVFQEMIINGSSFDFTDICKLLRKFAIKDIDKKYDSSLYRLKNRRNKLAHGVIGIIISENEIADYLDTVYNVIFEITEKISACYCEYNFLN